MTKSQRLPDESREEASEELLDQESHSFLRRTLNSFAAQFRHFVTFFGVRLLGWGLFGLVLACMTLPWGWTKQESAIKAGAIAKTDIIAPFDFKVLKPTEVYETEQTAMRNNVPYLMIHQPKVAARVEDRIDSIFGLTAKALREDSGREARLNRAKALWPTLSQANLEALLDLSSTRPLHLAVLRISREALRQRIIDDIPADLPDREHATFMVRYGDREEAVQGDQVQSITEMPAKLGPFIEAMYPRNAAQAELALALTQQVLEPNYRLDREETERRRKVAAEGVSREMGQVLRDELIVSAHQRVSPEAELKLASLQEEWLHRGGYTRILRMVGIVMSRLIMIALVVFLLAASVFLFRRDVFTNQRQSFLLILLLTLTAVLLMLAHNVWGGPMYIVPVAMVPMLVAILFDTRLALGLTVGLGMMAMLINEWNVTVGLFVQMTGIAAALSSVQVQRRMAFYRQTVYLLFFGLVVILAMDVIDFMNVDDIFRDLQYAALGVILCTLVSMGLLPAIEKLFKITTNLTLLELLDTSHPLMRRLIAEAPGTYHHSFMLSQMAEAASEAIGANSLLARVGALYHDVGKALNPHVFVENQRDQENVHDLLTTSESERLLRRHVEDGYEMAIQSGLPKVVADFILEHHGTAVMGYFLHKAEQAGETIPEGRFRYPGPKPQSKETAIVMLGDSVEAAVRSIKNPTSEQIHEKVEQIVEAIFQSNQLDECELTMRDIHHISQQFITVLESTYHKRIEYPQAK